MKKTLLAMALTGLLSSAAFAETGALNPIGAGADMAGITQAPMNHQVGQIARTTMLNQGLEGVDTIFDRTDAQQSGLWGALSYGWLKNDSYKIKTPAARLGYDQSLNDNLRLGLTAGFAQQKTDWRRPLAWTLEGKNSQYNIALYGRYEQNQWFADFTGGVWYQRNDYSTQQHNLALPDVDKTQPSAANEESQPANKPTSNVDVTVRNPNLVEGNTGVPGALATGITPIPSTTILATNGGVSPSNTPLNPLPAPTVKYKKSQTGFTLGARVGARFPVAEQFVITPSVQGTWVYGTAIIENGSNVQLGTLGVNVAADWKVKPEFNLGMDVSLTQVWTNAHKSVPHYAVTPPYGNLFNLDKGLKNDWRWKTGVHASYNATDRLSFGVEAAYQRYQKSKFGGMLFQLSGQYRF